MKKDNIPEEDKSYDYEDIHKKELDEIAEDEVVEEKVEDEPVEEKLVETPEPPKEEPKLDAEALAEDIATKLAEKTKVEEPVKTEQEEYQAWADKFKEEKGTEPSWTDVASHLKEEAVKEVENRQAEKIKQDEEIKAHQAETEKQQVEAFNKVVDEDLNDLYASEKLTPIKDKDNPSDQGVLERKALFQAMLETNQKRVAENKRPIYSIKEIYYEHYKKPNAQPAGENAPISLGKGTTNSDSEQELDYVKDVKKPWSFFRGR